MKKLFSLTLSLLMLIACSLRYLPLRQRGRNRPPWICGTAQ